MKLFRISTFLTMGLAALSGTALFLTSQKVQIAESRLNHLESAAAHEQKTIRVLSAEWDYLNQPARLEALARETLGMVPAEPGMVAASAGALPDVFMPALPARKPAHQIQPVKFTPTARPAQIEPAAGKAAKKPVLAEAASGHAAGEQSFESLLESLVEEGQ